ncbi:alpha/beta fold hydrolase [Aureisphaera galaxeae]|uniref:alpha/beta hydrolase n=1 Tax=Aureisphaera galaxeae TaxID=1538023 RepID=UPI0023501F20|nr:alpha/beta fold hydrolase [Aureisphaera galaxeae]MDC8003997.1 alpha/beta fold hydrolase [Aureisphaera galaxeae]
MKRLKKILGTFLGLYLIITILMFLLQEKLIFLPSTLPQDYAYTFQEEFEELFLEAEDGARLNALHFKVDNPKGLILYFHGNAGDLSRWGVITSEFTKYGYDVLVMDYRTYGKSTGKLSEMALYGDAKMFYKKAMELFPEDQIIVYGRSLGTTFATAVASHHHPQKLLLETPFYGLEELAKERYWFLPVSAFLKYQFPTWFYAENVKCPITIFHGTEDEVVPYHSGKQLYETLPKDQANLVTISGGSHNDLIAFPAYHEAIRKELQVD